MSERQIVLCWSITAVLLGLGLTVWSPGLITAILFTTVHNACYLALNPNASHFSLQVRFVYLGLLLVGQLPYCQWINWVQLLGTTALITAGYCPLARLLCLASWNRSLPLTWSLVTTVLMTPPVKGSFNQVVNPPLNKPGAAPSVSQP